jgi:hypothetical protein
MHKQSLVTAAAVANRVNPAITPAAGMADEEAVSLLQLPDPCLLAVLQCLADDAASLCSAARTHSRLHAAAVQALRSINPPEIKSQQLLDSMMPYLKQHGQNVDELCLRAHYSVALRQLPPEVDQLTSLHCLGGNVQLLPLDGFHGVLGDAGLPLKQLELACMGLTVATCLTG